MFGSYLKSIRTTLGLTQEQASIRLNLLGGDLANIDCVTFSRWERGITQPSLSRRVRVLRAFENNLLPYLCNLGLDTPLKDEVEQFELSLKQRYQDAMSIISGIDYKNAYPVVYDHIEEEELSQNNEQEFINSLNNFHNQLKSLNIKHSLATIDLVEYQKDNRAIAYKYLSKGELVGHNIGMFFTVPTLENELDRTKSNAYLSTRLTLD